MRILPFLVPLTEFSEAIAPVFSLFLFIYFIFQDSSINKKFKGMAFIRFFYQCVFAGKKKY